MFATLDIPFSVIYHYLREERLFTGTVGHS